MNRVSGNPNGTHVCHQPVLIRTKGWDTDCTATLLLGANRLPGRIKVAVTLDACGIKISEISVFFYYVFLDYFH